MKYRIIPEKSRTIALWSGGKTDQLFIWPLDSDYKRGDFSIRVSTATVDLDESDFTRLPGVLRKIMPLWGEMTLFCGDKPAARLRPFESLTFDGGLTTKSRGKCADFNLMLKNGAEGEIFPLQGEFSVPRGSFFGLYSPINPCPVSVDGGEIMLNSGDLLLVCQPCVVKVLAASPLPCFVAADVI